MKDSPKEAPFERIDNTQGFLALPFDGEQFKDFLTGLLGKPQKIEKVIEGSFEIGLGDIQNFHHLLSQRIKQQNDAKLLQFRAKISYDDRSSVELNSYEALETYNEIGPRISRSVVLSWDYLVLFQDKRYPQKQTVELGIYAGKSSVSNLGVFLLDQRMFIEGSGAFRITVLHTARTWATDIESLLTSHIETLLKSPDKYRKFVHRHETAISITVAALFYAIATVGGFWITRLSVDAKSSIARELINSQSELAGKIEVLSSFILQGIVAERYLELFVFLVISVVLAVILGTWVSSNIAVPEHSFILLTRKAVEERDCVLRSADKKWIGFFVSTATSLLVGVLSDYIFLFLSR